MILGRIHCETCGSQPITDLNSITVWYHPTSLYQMATVSCPLCQEPVEDLIDIETLAAFRMFKVRFLDFNDKFNPLTNNDIDSWDIESELKNYGY